VRREATDSVRAKRESIESDRSCVRGGWAYESLGMIGQRMQHTINHTCQSTYLSRFPTDSSVSGGVRMYASPLGCRGSGLSNDSGLLTGSASRGEACSAAEKEVGRGEGSSEPCCLVAVVGMPDVCERKAEKEGTVICAREDCFFTPAWEFDCGCNWERGGSGKLSCWRW